MKNYFIKKDYQINESPQTLDHVSKKAFWDKTYIKLSHAAQYYVYKLARDLAGQNNIREILDIGCGVGTILKKFFSAEEGFKILGVDQPAAVDYCRANIKNGIFVSDLIESPAYGLKSCLSTAPLIISADVIEHLLDPDKLLDYIKEFSDRNTLIVISTPERDAARGKDSLRPGNPYHIREWNYQEFHRYISESGFQILKHEIILSNKLNFDLATFRWIVCKIFTCLPVKHTQVVICKRR